ncbi:MAG: ADP-ribosylglycohydrolase family protein [Candidatus Eisenbacteria bacterium]|uniref:ADP-ribosylglycohydrolase family protein n=1 Tax=Eiseniibacteriota bacterium TaxID=2212470 RepID=A0A948WBP7_UNCEI|nr:ADP-ribosylglycohydrolase family protein [Candidatus Eisenbacteria bacterium]MBU1948158.1 ADP-ribosylglycohydrolase family protein [Candidatus Eisenbacteria bacterium]MBU2690173.1 ADP-ribosylglycohydrolase family protein [Candidatus Eisenbacteria bacterium]
MGRNRADRFVGSLLGLATGDALGRPLEGLSAEEIQQYYGRVTHFVEGPPHKNDRRYLPGLHSDDTQQALVIAETLLESGRADPDIIGRKFLSLARGPRVLPLGAHRGYGRSFEFTVDTWKRGCHWNGGARNSAGIGASMRVASVGLAFSGDDAAIRENAALQAFVTHKDPRGVAAACAVAYLVGRAIGETPESLDPENLLRATVGFSERTQEWLRDTHERHLSRQTLDASNHFSKALGRLSGHLADPPEKVLPLITQNAEEIAEYTLRHPCQGFALGGVIAAIYFFLHESGSFADAVSMAIHAGGDADSVAAITGAIAGALHGKDGIPEAWRDDLIGHNQITLRALGLSGEPFEPELWVDLPTSELEWTLAEEAMRREYLKLAPLTDAELADLQEIVIRPIEPRPERSRGSYESGSRRRDDSRGGDRGGDSHGGNRRDRDRSRGPRLSPSGSRERGR